MRLFDLGFIEVKENLMGIGNWWYGKVWRVRTFMGDVRSRLLGLDKNW